VNARAAGGPDRGARAQAFLAVRARPRVTIERWDGFGGAIQENIALDAVVEGGDASGGRGSCARVPLGVAVSHSRAEEYEILRAAHGAGVRARAAVRCHDGDGPISS
jgi:hypothetical protein